MPPARMSVLVPDRRIPWHRRMVDPVVSIRIHPLCPRCGRKRGRPERFGFTDHATGIRVVCDRWTNPCGHVDLYEEVIKEHERLAAGEE